MEEITVDTMDSNAPRILVADDEREILDGYKSVFAGHGTPTATGGTLSDLERELFEEAAPQPDAPSFDVVCCEQGEAAVQAVRAADEAGRPFAVAFLDVRMPPGMNGVAAAEAIRAIDPNVIIVIVTGFSDVRPQQIAQRVPPVDKLLYCRKPLHETELEHLGIAMSRKWLAERQLIGARERLDHLLSSSPGVIYSCEAEEDFIVTFVSENVRGLMGFDPDDFIGNPVFWSSRVHPSDLLIVSNSLARVLEEGAASCEYRFKGKDGSYRWINDGRKLIRDAKGNPLELVGYWVDVTKRKAAEHALIEVKRAAESADRAKTQFLANMNHEFRTPLNAIIGFADLIDKQTSGPAADPKLREYLRYIRDSGTHLLGLINRILDICKINENTYELRSEEVDIGSVIDESVRLLGLEARKLDHTVRTAIPEDLPKLRADFWATRQILINLLSNAVKFTPPGGVIEVTAGWNDAGRVWISVGDTGIGMDPEEVGATFTDFEQLDRRLERKFEGAGLGLSLAEALIKLHGGDILVDSALGKGTTVTVDFPAERVRLPSGARRAAAQP
jgi:PAS domain S-box-containing protein